MNSLPNLPGLVIVKILNFIVEDIDIDIEIKCFKVSDSAM